MDFLHRGKREVERECVLKREGERERERETSRGNTYTKGFTRQNKLSYGWDR